MKSGSDDQQQNDRMRYDSDNYKWGIFYFNPADPRVILPKRNPYLGLTFNFANPFTWFIIVLIIAFGIFFA